MNLKHYLLAICLMAALGSHARSRVLSPDINTLQAVVNDDWLALLPVMQLGSDDVMSVSFDQMSHSFHRYHYRLEHCEADWTASDDLFESDWLEGFNSNPIDDYEYSLNTTVDYTHYRLELPNERCRLKMSGNYRLWVTDDDNGDEPVLCVEFMVVEPVVQLGLGVTTNTDIDHNISHQQVSMTLNYDGLTVTNPTEQLRTVVMQNGRHDNSRVNVKPTHVTANGLRWEHCRQLIFDGGNEYHKFEVLDVSHPTMGIDRMWWDGSNFHAYPYDCTPRRNYSYDEDADGAFIVRNSDNIECYRLCDYVYVHYRLAPARRYDMAHLVVDGAWATGSPDLYRMTYDEADQSYNAVVLQKQGYYSYQFLMVDDDGQATHTVPEEGSFSETENTYQALAYYRGSTDRTWRLVGYQQVKLK